jgi:hypothetical protein
MFPLDLIEHLRDIPSEEHLYREEDSKEVQDLDKTSPVKEQVYNDEKNESFPFWKKKTKHYALRIKPLVMKRHWRSMSIKGDVMKKKNNYDEVPHTENPDETSIPILSLDEDEVAQPCFPPAHKDEEVISPKDADGSMGDLSDMVDQHLDDFIHIGRRRWDMGFTFDRDPIYDIEGGSQEKRDELSSSEDWSSCAYDSDAFQPDDDMVIDLFHPV